MWGFLLFSAACIVHHTWQCPSPLGSRSCINSLFMIEIFFPRHCESYQMLLSFCTKNGSLPAPLGDNHVPPGDLSLHAQTTDWASCGEWSTHRGEGFACRITNPEWSEISRGSLQGERAMVRWAGDRQGTWDGVIRRVRAWKHNECYCKLKKVSKEGLRNWGKLRNLESVRGRIWEWPAQMLISRASGLLGEGNRMACREFPRALKLQIGLG